VLAGRHHQRLVHQRGDEVDHLAVISAQRAHPLGAGRRGAAAEHRQPPQRRPLGLVEQLPAWGWPPADGTNRSIEELLAFVTEDLPGLRTG
jgi:hypothetical protein